MINNPMTKINNNKKIIIIKYHIWQSLTIIFISQCI